MTRNHVVFVVVLLVVSGIVMTTKWHVQNHHKVQPNEFERLATALRSPDRRVRLNALHAALRRRSEAPTAVPVLVAALDDEYYECRFLALCILGELGHSAHDATEAVITRLADEVSLIRGAACRTLAKIATNDERAIAVLIPMLADSHCDVRKDATWAMGQLSAAPVTISLLQKQLTDEAPCVRAAAAEAFRKMGPIASSAVTTLIAALDDPADYVRLAMIRALGHIGAPAESSLATLVKIARNEKQPASVRLAAVDAIAQIRSWAAPLVIHCGDLLSHEDEGIRKHASVVLSVIAAPTPEESRMIR